MSNDETEDTERGDYAYTLGLVSDTHSWLDEKLVDIFRDYECDRILHAGDIGDEAVLERLEDVAPVSAVKGNIDGGDLRFLPEEEVVEVGPMRIAILHIAGSPRRPRKQAREFIEREEPDAIVVGHSHVPVVGRVKGTLWINPGAAGRHGFHAERFAALLHINREGEFEMDRIHLGSRSKQQSPAGLDEGPVPDS